MVEITALNAVGAAFFTLVAYFISSTIYNIFFHPLRSYPGPLLNAASPLPRAWQRISGTEIPNLHRLHQQYGDVVRLSPNELDFIDPKAWKEIHGHPIGGKPALPKDPRSYGPASYDEPGMFVSDDVSHARQRRIFSHAFSDRALKEQEPLLSKYVHLLVHQLTTKSASGPLDLVKWYNFTTFDVMGDLTFGEPLQLLQGSEYNAWVGNIFGALKLLGMMNSLRFYFPMALSLLQLMIPPSLKAKSDEHKRFTKDRVTKRLEQETERPDIWSLVMRRKDDALKALTMGEMLANAEVFMIAGTETTATLLSGCTFYLLKNPDVMKKLAEEVRGSFASKEEMTLESLRRLPFMNACLEEALRMYPPVPVGLPRRTPRQGFEVCGKLVPGNVTIMISQYPAYRSPKNFALPDEFHPERWMTELDDPRFKNDNKATLQPFSLGPRNCIGKNLAYHEMRLILANIVYHFDLSLCEESANWSDQKTWALWEKHPLMVRVEPVVRG
ncbi:benzoate 4-monooxygenase cytochrome P450 [Saccharata proteae CBS 121410]|uniref:Benzoate 4-monooxygenase cytochrome P450 n=1 Tax=Saccharata proteae CBS 121410 TaxID=1314787 RepID=A0A9P4LYB3_9PEZI|nr:benzoate 4-monooxygenase cytochrome P450 [Saccharata proteae CBS 121410]